MVRDVKPGGVFLINCQWTPEELNEHMPAEAKRYIAKNNIQLYTINAIDKAIEIGLGKRTNTILQSAFFALAGVLPKEDAINYMKDAATRSFSKKGEAIVKMNHDAIDAGFDYYVKIDVPADWANAEDKKVEEVLPGNNKKLINMVQTIMEPVAKMDGDSLPVSAFVDHADGTFEQGAAAYEKRGVAVMVPVWDETKCIQCNRCSYVCPHATIRPFALSEEEVANAPAGLQTAKMIGKGLEEYRFTMAVSPMDCMGCGVCVGECPAKEKAITMVPRESQESKQPVFDYLVANVSKKPGMPAKETVKGSQFEKPLLEFSGSCAGCAETAYARLITQLFGDRMYISNATGCSSIWGGPAATSPYTVNEKGHGPAWANSLFEDNAEHGFGMYLGQKVIRERLIEKVRDVVENGSNEAVKVAGQKYLDTVNNGKENQAATEELIAALEACGCDKAKEILSQKEYLSKKSVWVFGGDGWAYDIGFGGLDHVLAQNQNVNILVFDTEVYSNTGGQASKATPTGAVAQFAATGKVVKKKDLAAIAMSYGYVYVAQVAMGADYNQCLKAFHEAESYDGPSIIIAYAPCINHGIKGGMGISMTEEKAAVASGYWHNFRFDPRLAADGKNPFSLDSKEPSQSYRDFIMNEVRYNSLLRAFPDRAECLFEKSEEYSKEKYQHLLKLKDLYAPAE